MKPVDIAGEQVVLDDAPILEPPYGSISGRSADAVLRLDPARGLRGGKLADAKGYPLSPLVHVEVITIG